jgi:hypothetical protein
MVESPHGLLSKGLWLGSTAESSASHQLHLHPIPNIKEAAQEGKSEPYWELQFAGLLFCH